MEQPDIALFTARSPFRYYWKMEGIGSSYTVFSSLGFEKYIVLEMICRRHGIVDPRIEVYPVESKTHYTAQVRSFKNLKKKIQSHHNQQINSLVDYDDTVCFGVDRGVTVLRRLARLSISVPRSVPQAPRLSDIEKVQSVMLEIFFQLIYLDSEFAHKYYSRTVEVTHHAAGLRKISCMDLPKDFEQYSMPLLNYFKNRYQGDVGNVSDELRIFFSYIALHIKDKRCSIGKLTAMLCELIDLDYEKIITATINVEWIIENMYAGFSQHFDHLARFLRTNDPASKVMWLSVFDDSELQLRGYNRLYSSGWRRLSVLTQFPILHPKRRAAGQPEKKPQSLPVLASPKADKQGKKPTFKDSTHRFTGRVISSAAMASTHRGKIQLRKPLEMPEGDRFVLPKLGFVGGRPKEKPPSPKKKNMTIL